VTGDKLYYWLEKKFGQTGAAKILSQAGYVGNRVPLDAKGNYTGGAAAHYNYVVWDDKDVEIQYHTAFNAVPEDGTTKRGLAGINDVYDASEDKWHSEKDWALRGKGLKGGRRDAFSTMLLKPGFYLPYMTRMREKYRKIEDNEIRYESVCGDDAQVLLIAYGSTARISLEAVSSARTKGLKWGLFRPITLWPFPHAQLRKAAEACKTIVVVEDSMGQMIEDVRLAVRDQMSVHLVGTLSRHNPGSGGMIFPERVYEEVSQWL